MNWNKYGPFANVVGMASVLVALFSALVFKAMGKVKTWSAMTSGSPPIVVKTGARGLAIALMALTYVVIDKSNYVWFAVAAAFCGALLFISVVRFERLRELHIVRVPLVAADGKPLKTWWGRDRQVNLAIGRETEMRQEAKDALANARKQRGGVSVRQFMSGYGSQGVNDPEAIWDGELLAKVRSRLTTVLMLIVLLASLVLFWSAFTIDVATR